MKNKLPEYYEPTEAEIKEIWNHGIIVLDANVLLNLFRYSKNGREELIKIIKHYQDRVWLPYQVAYEFLENSEIVPASLNNAINDMAKAIDSINGTIESQLKLNNYDKYHLIKPNELRSEIKKFQESLRKRIEKIKSEFETVDRKIIVKQVTDIFNGKVGDDYSEEKLEQIIKEGEKRFKEKTPPGYKDLDEKKNAPKRHLYGDFIWWKQAIDYSKENHCDLIIVTDDAKEDWWYKVNNETKSPRVELIREFSKQTDGQSFHMYRTGQFMEFAKKYDKVTISEKSIKEIKGISSINYGHLFGGISDPSNSQIGGGTYQQLFNIDNNTAGIGLQGLNPAVTDYFKVQEANKDLFSHLYAPITKYPISGLLSRYCTFTPDDYLTNDPLSDYIKKNSLK